MPKSLYRNLKDIWQKLPQNWIVRIRRMPFIGKLVRKVADATVKNASHQEIYDDRYYDFIDRTASQSAAAMAESIVDCFSPKSVLDVGCGTGALLSAFKIRGIYISGLEYSDAGITRCRQKGVPVTKFDLENSVISLEPSNGYDITMSFEVAEHLPEMLADKYVAAITKGSPILIFTAATPGQGGLDHVNEQPHSYWIAKITMRGYNFEKHLSFEFRERWQKRGVASWYANNLMIFRKIPPS